MFTMTDVFVMCKLANTVRKMYKNKNEHMNRRFWYLAGSFRKAESTIILNKRWTEMIGHVATLSRNTSNDRAKLCPERPYLPIFKILKSIRIDCCLSVLIKINSYRKCYLVRVDYSAVIADKNKYRDIMWM